MTDRTDMMRSREPIRILLIIARLNIGGPAIHAVTLTRKFSDRGFETLLATGPVDSNEGDMGYLAEAAGVKPVKIPELGRSLSPARDFRAFFKLRKIICRFRPHIVHTHTAKAGTLGRLAAMSVGRRIATVHTFHGHVFHGYFGRFKSSFFIFIERMLARLTDRIVVLSKSQQREICRFLRIAPADRVRIVPLGFDLDPFRDAADRCDLKLRNRLEVEHADKDTFLVGCIGRLTPIKNHRMLLEAVRCLKENGRLDGLSIAVVGGGELEDSLRESAKVLGVADRIRFCGWFSDTPPVYSALDAVVLTSRNEGTPMTIIEAMAAGKPVAATGVGGVPDLLGPVVERPTREFFRARRGLIVSPGSPRGLADAIDWIRENPLQVEVMTLRARNWVFEHYGLDRLCRDLEQLYLNIAGRN